LDLYVARAITKSQLRGYRLRLGHIIVRIGISGRRDGGGIGTHSAWRAYANTSRTLGREPHRSGEDRHGKRDKQNHRPALVAAKSAQAPGFGEVPLS
jgi:hypothetical protein